MLLKGFFCTLQQTYKFWHHFRENAKCFSGVQMKLLKGRSSYRRCSLKKGILQNCSKFSRNRLCQSLSFNKVAERTPATLLKERFSHRCFPVIFEQFLRAPPGGYFGIGELLFKCIHMEENV